MYTTFSCVLQWEFCLPNWTDAAAAVGEYCTHNIALLIAYNSIKNEFVCEQEYNRAKKEVFRYS